METETKLWLVGALWVVFFIVRWGVKQSRRPGLTNFSVFWLDMNAAIERPRYLCGYHAAAELRPGLSAVVDGNQCEECRRENDWLGNTNARMEARKDSRYPGDDEPPRAA